MKHFYLFFCFAIFLYTEAAAQSTADYAVQLTDSVSVSPPHDKTIMEAPYR